MFDGLLGNLFQASPDPENMAYELHLEHGQSMKFMSDYIRALEERIAKLEEMLHGSKS